MKQLKAGFWNGEEYIPQTKGKTVGLYNQGKPQNTTPDPWDIHSEYQTGMNPYMGYGAPDQAAQPKVSSEALVGSPKGPNVKKPMQVVPKKKKYPSQTMAQMMNSPYQKRLDTMQALSGVASGMDDRNVLGATIKGGISGALVQMALQNISQPTTPSKQDQE